METAELANQIEAILFYKAQPVEKSTLISQLSIEPDKCTEALTHLTERLANGATRVLETDTEVSLVTAPEYSGLIESLRREELKRDIGKAGAETLAIILYRSPVSRVEIDRIRGVNSSFIVRNLQVRGLIEKSTNTKRVEYQPTTNLLAHLGITHKNQLPAYEDILNQLAQFEMQVASEKDQ